MNLNEAQDEAEALLHWRDYWLKKKMAASIDLYIATKRSLVVPIMTKEAIEEATEKARILKLSSEETIKNADEFIGVIDEMLKKYGKSNS